MASGPITSWQIDGETMETVTDCFLGLQNHCRWWLQPWPKTLALWKKSCYQPRQHIKKQRHHFADKGRYSQSYGFSPVVMYRCESWTIKKAECRRIDAFEPWCWRRLLRVSWTARRSSQSILKKINSRIFIERTDAEAEAPILCPLMQRAGSLGNTQMTGRIEAGREGINRGWDGWMASPTQWTWVCANFRRWGDEGQGSLACFSHGVTEWTNWTTISILWNVHVFCVHVLWQGLSELGLL